MDPTRLDYFLAVANARTLSEAAEELRVSQPAVSVALRALERELGFPLFDRVGRRLVLNDAGGRMREHAQAARAALQGAEACARDIRGLKGGELTLALPGGSPAGIVSLVAGFRRDYPDIMITLTQADDTPQVTSWVLEGSVDLGLINGPTPVQQCRSLTIDPGESVLLVPSDHALAERESVCVDDLAGLELITSKAGSFSDEVLHEAATQGVHIAPVLHCQLRGAVPGLVKQGIGVAVVARALVDPDDAGIRQIPFHPRQRYPRALVWRTGPHSPATMAFLRATRDRLAKSSSGSR